MVIISISVLTFVLGSVFPHNHRNMKQFLSAPTAKIREKEIVKIFEKNKYCRYGTSMHASDRFGVARTTHHLLNFSISLI